MDVDKVKAEREVSAEIQLVELEVKRKELKDQVKKEKAESKERRYNNDSE